MKYFRLKSREHAFAVSVYRSMKQIGVIAAIQASEDIVSKVLVIEDLATVWEILLLGLNGSIKPCLLMLTEHTAVWTRVRDVLFIVFFKFQGWPHVASAFLIINSRAYHW